MTAGDAPASAPAASPEGELAEAQRRSLRWSARSVSSRLIWIFSASLAASQGEAPAERRAWREVVYALIEAMTAPLPQGTLSVERMCRLAGVSRAGYYRHWQASAPRQEEAVVAMRSSALRWRSATTATGGSRRSCGARAWW